MHISGIRKIRLAAPENREMVLVDELYGDDAHRRMGAVQQTRDALRSLERIKFSVYHRSDYGISSKRMHLVRHSQLALWARLSSNQRLPLRMLRF